MKLYALLLCLSAPLYADSLCQIINFPGFYQFTSDTIGFPSDPNDAIICIESSNVILDMTNHIITQDSSNTVPGLVGIRIAPGLSDVTIINAEIKNLTGIGIEVGFGCSSIVINNIEVTNCAQAGILLSGTNPDAIKNVNITNCLISSCAGFEGSPAYGLRCVSCDNVEVEQCTFNDNDAVTLNTGFGVSLELCTACRIRDCKANNNGGNALAAGISLYQCNWTVLDNCKVLNTIARSGVAGSRATGILISNSTNTTVLNCISKHNNNLLAEASGFEARDGSDNTFSSCITKNNVGATVGAGFVLRGTEVNSSIFKCKSRLNDGGASGIGYGIYLDSAQNCDIWYNQLVGNMGANGYGLVDDVIDTNNLIAGNSAFGNATSGYNVTRTVGSFPVLNASVSDFSTIAGASKYINIDFI